MKGSSSVAPVAIARRVEYASNAAAPCWTTDSKIQFRRDGSLSTPILPASLPSEGASGRRITGVA